MYCRLFTKWVDSIGGLAVGGMPVEAVHGLSTRRPDSVSRRVEQHISHNMGRAKKGCLWRLINQARWLALSLFATVGLLYYHLRVLSILRSMRRFPGSKKLDDAAMSLYGSLAGDAKKLRGFVQYSHFLIIPSLVLHHSVARIREYLEDVAALSAATRLLEGLEKHSIDADRAHILTLGG